VFLPINPLPLNFANGTKMGNVKTFTLMALIYTLTTPIKHKLLSTTKGGLGFNHAMGVIDIIGYALIDGLL
jgi:hypothetical protein